MRPAIERATEGDMGMHRHWCGVCGDLMEVDGPPSCQRRKDHDLYTCCEDCLAEIVALPTFELRRQFVLTMRWKRSIEEGRPEPTPDFLNPNVEPLLSDEEAKLAATVWPPVGWVPAWSKPLP
jgi:hypothetical protein